MTETRNAPIAIVGIGCRFPGGASSPDAFWRILRERVDATGTVPPGRWPQSAFHPDRAHPGTTDVTRGGFLTEPIDGFDARFFGLSPREASRIDPQQRLLLEVAWEALEDAGQPPQALAGGATGVFVGISTHDYEALQFRDARSINAYTMTGGAHSLAANRISHALDLRGPSVAIDSACSSSLSALHAACTSIHVGECPSALVGAASLLIAPEPTIGFTKASMLSPDGRCYAFDARANGYARGEGAAVILLKPLAAARADGDRIYAVIRATGVNQDGHTQGISVPSQRAQETLIREVCERAGVRPQDLDYVEAHGTGTPVGDPIECRALGRAAGESRPPDRPLRIGSVKTNLGHLEAAAGMAGLIKTALALHHERIPPSLHFETPNPEIAFGDLGLDVVTSEREWTSSGEKPRLAGVNSFGFGGTNAHAVLAAAPDDALDLQATPTGDGELLLPISARSMDALGPLARAYAERLRDGADPAALCAAAAVRYGHHPCRASVAGDSADALAAGLDALADGEPRRGVFTAKAPAGARPRVVFAFSGNGTQWWAMGRELLRDEPVFAHTIASLDTMFSGLAGFSILDELRADEADSRMSQTEVAQPALFALQLGLVAILRGWGVEADAVIGHSVGEIAAAHVAGILDRRDAIAVIHHRSRAQARTAGTGRMAALGLEPSRARELIRELGGRVAIAAVNSASAVTVSGDADALEELGRVVQEMGAAWHPLRLDYAFHSRHMDPIRGEVETSLDDISPLTASIPFYSAVEGRRLDGPELTADYWWRNIREPVLFADAIGALTDDGYDAVIEIGPHPVLLPYLSEELGRRNGRTRSLLTTLRRREDEGADMRRCVGALYAQGHPVRWTGLHRPTVAHVDLPRYPWQRERHWSAPDGSLQRIGGDPVHPLLGREVPSSQHEWQTSIDPRLIDWLADHVVQGAVVFPAAAFVELAAAAVHRIDADAEVAIDGFEIRAPLVTTNGAAAIVHTSVDPREGWLRIATAPRNGEDAWREHVTARVEALPATDTVDHLSTLTIHSRCDRELTAEQHYAALAAVGLNYGPAFRGVTRVRAGPSDALGEIELPAEATRGGNGSEYWIHPAGLDACFQVAFGLLDQGPDQARPETFLPVRIDRLRLRHPSRATTHRLRCHARLVERRPSRLVLDMTIADAAGRVVATIEGFRFRRMPSLVASRADRGITFTPRWVAGARTAPRSNRPAPAWPDPTELTTDLTGSASRLATEHDRGRLYRVIEPELDRLCAAYVWRALAQLGCDLRAGATIDPDTLARAHGVLPAHRRLLGRMLGMLEEDGRLTREGEALRVSALLPPPDPESAWRDFATQHPAYHAVAELIARTGPALADVLRGETEALDLIFADDATIAHFYESSPLVLIYNELVGRAVAGLVGSLPPGAALRVVEVGAGTGGTTAHALPMLDPERTDYLFTDVSDHFLARAGQRFDRVDFLRYAVLDVERDIVEQGFEPGCADILIAANVLHATSDLRRTLSNIRRLLSPRGALVLLETTRPLRVADLIFGLLPGWWRFVDRDLRPDHALISPSTWRSLLAEQGLTDVSGVSEVEGERAHQTLLLARAPAETRAQTPRAECARWLVLMDDGDVGERLADRLARRGHSVTRARATSGFEQLGHDEFGLSLDGPDDLTRLIEQLVAEDAAPAGVIDLAGLPPAGTSAADASTLLDAEERGPIRTLHVVQALARARVKAPRLWLVTTGVHAPDPADPAHALELGVFQAPTWGVGRVASNEHPELRTTLIDLSPRGPADEELDALIDELEGDRDEPELCLRGRVRRVARLERTPAGEPRAAAPTEAPTGFRITPPASRSLDDLRPTATAPPEPRANEVLVEVDAAALNFRDLMIAMGLLADDAVESGWLGAAIGGECAGRVAAVGEAVRRFAVGDVVVGVVRHGLASHAMSTEELLAAVPDGLRPEHAVTIPMAFVTAHHALNELARVREGERVLVQSAAGGVGLAAIQLAHRAGATVIATAGSPRKRDFLRRIGVEGVLDSRSPTFDDEARALTGGAGVDVVLNSVAGSAIEKGIALLRPFGRFIEIGKRDLFDDRRIGLRALRRNAAFFAVDLDAMLCERPEEVGRLLRDVMDACARGELAPLPHRFFDLDDAPRAFRSMQRSDHIGKIVLRRPRHRVRVEEPPAPVASLRCHRDASYIITGGLGGFGLATARWLAERGAGHLILVGRRGPDTPGIGATVEELESAGASVTVLRLDVRDETQVAAVLRDLKRSHPPVRGVVHGAMVLDDGILLQLDAQRMRRATDPKARGAWNLHRHTRELPLDFFVLYSSFTSLVGNPGQAGYVAGNAFLDALAHHRRAAGLTATTVNWGPISEVGFVAENDDVRSNLSRRGMVAIPPSEALALLGRLIATGATQVGVMDFDCTRWIDATGRTVTPGLAQLVARSADDAAAPTADATTPGPERATNRAAIEALLLQSVATILQTAGNQLDPSTPLTSLGLDSLMAVELRGRIESHFGVDVPVLQLMQGPTIGELSAQIAGSLQAPETDAA